MINNLNKEALNTYEENINDESSQLFFLVLYVYFIDFFSTIHVNQKMINQVSWIIHIKSFFMVFNQVMYFIS